MKRSEINGAIRRMEALIAAYRFALPPFLSWTPADWARAGSDCDEIRDNMLGWDVTDFGRGNFPACGLSLITLRNGSLHDSRYPKPYAEKLLMLDPGQTCPMHFHWYKMEDIINRGGGTVVFRFCNASREGEPETSDVLLQRDGRHSRVAAGEEVELAPGESLTLMPSCYHEFFVRPGSQAALLGEVSMCNDDTTDNRFLETAPRFPTIVEDEPAWRLLCTEYPRAAV